MLDIGPSLPKKTLDFQKPKKWFLCCNQHSEQTSNPKKKTLLSKHHSFSSVKLVTSKDVLKGSSCLFGFQTNRFLLVNLAIQILWATPTAQAKGVQPQLSRESTEAPAFHRLEDHPGDTKGTTYWGLLGLYIN